jgi:hypothetical protein
MAKLKESVAYLLEKGRLTAIPESDVTINARKGIAYVHRNGRDTELLEVYEVSKPVNIRNPRNPTRRGLKLDADMLITTFDSQSIGYRLTQLGWHEEHVDGDTFPDQNEAQTLRTLALMSRPNSGFNNFLVNKGLARFLQRHDIQTEISEALKPQITDEKHGEKIDRSWGSINLALAKLDRRSVEYLENAIAVIFNPDLIRGTSMVRHRRALDPRTLEKIGQVLENKRMWLDIRSARFETRDEVLDERELGKNLRNMRSSDLVKRRNA